MITLIKTTVVIVILTLISCLILKKLAKKECKKPLYKTVGITGLAFSCLCVTQPWVAFAGLGSITSYFTRKKSIAAGIFLFLTITIPGISIKVMAGSLQLINFSTITASIIGLIAGSLFWNKSSKQNNLVQSIPVYMLVIVITFIIARDTSITNVIRVVVENTIAFIIPYYLIRNCLKDNDSIRNAFILIIAAGISISLVAIFESIKVWPVYQIYGQRFGTLTLAGVKMRGGMLRASGPLMNPPLSSAVLALCFVVNIAARDLFKTKIGHRTIIVIMASGLFVMQSRVGWLGAICGSIGVIVANRGFKEVFKYVPGILSFASMLYVSVLLNENIANMIGFSADAKGSSAYRDQLSELGFEIIKSHPLIGQSIGVVELQMSSLRQGEGIVDFTNGYLAVALFSGIPGFIIFIGSFVLQIVNSQRGMRITKLRRVSSFSGLGIGVAISAISMFSFIPTDYRILIIIIMLFTLSNSIFNCKFGNEKLILNKAS